MEQMNVEDQDDLNKLESYAHIKDQLQTLISAAGTKTDPMVESDLVEVQKLMQDLHACIEERDSMRRQLKQERVSLQKQIEDYKRKAVAVFKLPENDLMY